MAAGGSDLESSFKSSGPGVPLKVILVGVKGVGKTTLFRRIFSGKEKFSEEKHSNIRECFTQPIKVDGRTVQMCLFDTAGMEGNRHQRTLTRSYFLEAQVALLVYSADDWDSVEDLLEYAQDVQTHAPAAKKFLIRNKVDLPKEDQNFDVNDVDNLFAKRGICFAPNWKFSTSASEGVGIDTLLSGIGQALLSQGSITPSDKNSFQVFKPKQDHRKSSQHSNKCC